MKNAWIGLLVVMSFVGTTNAAVLELPVTKGQVQFDAVGRPSMMKIKGQGASVQGNITVSAQKKASGVLKFPLASLETGMDLRNQHMKEKYLEVAKHPEAKLELKEVSLPADWSVESPNSADMPFTGILELHGVSKEVQGTFKFTDGRTAQAKFEIKISDFKIDIPSYLGVTVADTVKVQVTLPDLLQSAVK